MVVTWIKARPGLTKCEQLKAEAAAEPEKGGKPAKWNDSWIH
jgi:hypothetical protein